ncbi:hypothetical protein ACJX0J_014277, partial [Zea mays]
KCFKYVWWIDAKTAMDIYLKYEYPALYISTFHVEKKHCLALVYSKYLLILYNKAIGSLGFFINGWGVRNASHEIATCQALGLLSNSAGNLIASEGALLLLLSTFLEGLMLPIDSSSDQSTFSEINGVAVVTKGIGTAKFLQKSGGQKLLDLLIAPVNISFAFSMKKNTIYYRHVQKKKEKEILWQLSASLTFPVPFSTNLKFTHSLGGDMDD